MWAIHGWKNATAEPAAAEVAAAEVAAAGVAADGLAADGFAGDGVRDGRVTPGTAGARDFGARGFGARGFGAGAVRTEAVGLLAAGVAHDLNNMLAGIVSTAELVQGRLTSEAARRDLQAVLDQAMRASALVGQLLSFARQDVLAPADAPLAELVQSAWPGLEALGGPGLELEPEPEPAAPEQPELEQRPALPGAGAQAGRARVRVDPVALERALQNLVLNARQAAGPGGRVRLRLARMAPQDRPPAARAFMPAVRHAVVWVEDDGPGVPEALAERIFEPFFTTRPGGQGLGLSSAFGLVKQSGGYLLLERSALGGAAFALCLPELVIGAGGVPGAGMGAGVGAGDAAARVVLLVEDDLLLRMSTARALERAGYRVRQAGDAEAALRRLEGERPALLLSDVRLPGRDGVALAEAARVLAPDLPVLLVTGFADETAQRRAAGLGLPVLRKPYTMKLLEDRIRALV